LSGASRCATWSCAPAPSPCDPSGRRRGLLLRDLEIGQSACLLRRIPRPHAARWKALRPTGRPGRRRSGRAEVRLDGTGGDRDRRPQALRLKLGGSGFAASGSWALGRRAGEVRLRDLGWCCRRILELVLAGVELKARSARGRSEERREDAGLDLRLDAGGGPDRAKVTRLLRRARSGPSVSADKVESGALSARAPSEVHGASRCTEGHAALDAHGVEGAPVCRPCRTAQLAAGGPSSPDLEASPARTDTPSSAPFTATAPA